MTDDRYVKVYESLVKENAQLKATLEQLDSEESQLRAIWEEKQ